MVFAVKPVPRNEKKVEIKNVTSASEIVQKKTDEKDKKDDDKKEKDRIIDKNGDGVNDQREDDLQKIKNTKSKHKDLIKKKNANTPAVNKKPATPKKIKKK
jgi:hypothetical protein